MSSNDLNFRDSIQNYLNKRKTPADFPITPRQPNLHFPDSIPQHYFGNSIYKSHFFSGLSMLLPRAEKYLIETFLPFREKIKGTELERETNAFIIQEVAHTSAHKAFNELLAKRGIPLDLCDAVPKKLEERILAKKNPLLALSLTVAYEHYTAAMSRVILNDPHFLESFDPTIGQLFKWHMVEEIEHKAVAFDLFKAMGGSYFLRCWGMLIASKDFLQSHSIQMHYLLKNDNKVFDWRVHWDGMKFLFSFRNGFIFKILPHLLEFFLPNFHPWNIDDRPLIQNTIKELNLDTFTKQKKTS